MKDNTSSEFIDALKVSSLKASDMSGVDIANNIFGTSQEQPPEAQEVDMQDGV